MGGGYRGVRPTRGGPKKDGSKGLRLFGESRPTPDPDHGDGTGGDEQWEYREDEIELPGGNPSVRVTTAPGEDREGGRHRYRD